MRSINTTRSLILGGVLVGALTLGAVQMASGDTSTDPEPANPQVTGVEGGARDVKPAIAPVDPTDPTVTTRERGIVLEGKGVWRGQPVSISVYENQTHGNVLQMVIGNPDGKHSIASGEGRDPYVIDGVLNVGLPVDGHLAIVKGTVKPNGPAQAVTEDNPDGDLVSSRGKHVPLKVEATFEYRGESVGLVFDWAIRYDLNSTRG